MSRFAPRLVLKIPSIDECINLLPNDVKKYIYSFLVDEVEEKIKKIITKMLRKYTPVSMSALHFKEYYFWNNSIWKNYIMSLSSHHQQFFNKYSMNEIYKTSKVISYEKSIRKQSKFFNDMLKDTSFENRIVINKNKAYFVLKNKFIQIIYEPYCEHYDMPLSYKLTLANPKILTIKDINFENFEFLKFFTGSKLYIHNINTNTTKEISRFQLSSIKICKDFQI